MRRFDVFNGDADGICALHQLRLAEPCDAELVTGLKHEITLLDRVDAGAGDLVTVLDVSLERNRAALVRLLERGARVRYFDHHHAGEPPRHPNLEAHLDASGLACTSELVDRWLGGRFRAWAVVAAFGDNFDEAAARLAEGLDLDARRLARLRSLGQAINYNAYGASREDVLVGPEALYRRVSGYRDPLAMAQSDPIVARLEAGREADLARAFEAAKGSGATAAHLLPDAAWSRRVQGAFANHLAREAPERAHAVLVPMPGGGYGVSVRTPRDCALSAVGFCRRYPGGGGRATAAGIERLDASELTAFLDAFARAYPPGP